MTVQATPSGNHVLLSFPYDEMALNGEPLRKYMSLTLGAKWFRPFWKLTPIQETLETLEKLCVPEYRGNARNILLKASKVTAKKITPFPHATALFKRKPRQHQSNALDFVYGEESAALFMDMGTGKTKVVIDLVCQYYRENKVSCLIVVCPKNLVQNWADEFAMDKWDKVEAEVVALEGSGSKKARSLEKCVAMMQNSDKLHVIITNYDCLLNTQVKLALTKILSSADTLVACDESTYIKNPQAKRTKHLVSMRDLAQHRLVLTGSPVTEAPTDVFGQYQFIDPTVYGNSFVAFRAEYCDMGGFEGRQIIGYKNIAKFQQKLYKKAFRVQKSECMDLPPKIYVERPFTMSDEQRELHTKMANEMVAELRGEEFSVNMAMTKIMRLQEISSGYIKQGDTIKHLTKGNPKMDALMELLDEASDQKIIIWCREHEEIRNVVAALEARELAAKKRLPKSNVMAPVFQFHGEVKDKDRDANKKAFIAHPGKAYMVMNPQSGGMGLTLVCATMMIYYSNLFSMKDREQSEDRAHRDGQTKSVTIVDLYAKDSVDEHVMKILKRKKHVKNMFMEVKGIVEDFAVKAGRNGHI